MNNLSKSALLIGGVMLALVVFGVVLGATIALGGDVTGGQTDTRVVGINGRPIDAGRPADGDVLRWDTTDETWEYHAISSVTGSLPTGSAVLDELAWDSDVDAWVAVSSTTTVYYATTTGATYADLAAALTTGLGNLNANREHVGSDFVVKGGYPYNVFDAPILGDTLWVLAPNATGWIDDFSSSGQPAFTVTDNFMRINGVPYDVGQLTITGSPSSLSVTYDPPATTYTIQEGI